MQGRRLRGSAASYGGYFAVVEVAAAAPTGGPN